MHVLAMGLRPHSYFLLILIIRVELPDVVFRNLVKPDCGIEHLEGSAGLDRRLVVPWIRENRLVTDLPKPAVDLALSGVALQPGIPGVSQLVHGLPNRVEAIRSVCGDFLRVDLPAWRQGQEIGQKPLGGEAQSFIIEDGFGDSRKRIVCLARGDYGAGGENLRG